MSDTNITKQATPTVRTSSLDPHRIVSAPGTPPGRTTRPPLRPLPRSPNVAPGVEIRGSAPIEVQMNPGGAAVKNPNGSIATTAQPQALPVRRTPRAAQPAATTAPTAPAVGPAAHAAQLTPQEAALALACVEDDAHAQGFGAYASLVGKLSALAAAGRVAVPRKPVTTAPASAAAPAAAPAQTAAPTTPAATATPAGAVTPSGTVTPAAAPAATTGAPVATTTTTTTTAPASTSE